jgi:hypothetical protein
MACSVVSVGAPFETGPGSSTDGRFIWNSSLAMTAMTTTPSRMETTGSLLEVEGSFMVPSLQQVAATGSTIRNQSPGRQLQIKHDGGNVGQTDLVERDTLVLCDSLILGLAVLALATIPSLRPEHLAVTKH